MLTEPIAAHRLFYDKTDCPKSANEDKRQSATREFSSGSLRFSSDSLFLTKLCTEKAQPVATQLTNLYHANLFSPRKLGGANVHCPDNISWPVDNPWLRSVIRALRWKQQNKTPESMLRSPFNFLPLFPC
jgi:hypothetical protein